MNSTFCKLTEKRKKTFSSQLKAELEVGLMVDFSEMNLATDEFVVSLEMQS